MDNTTIALKTKAQAMSPSVQVGKNGLTDNSIKQIALHLKAHKLTKVKFNNNFLDGNDKEESINKLATELKAEIIDKIGNIVVFWKR